jgi:hypothetical protein
MAASPQLAISDRAFRYRAQKAIPRHAKVCAFCGRKNPGLMIAHVDGHEENGEPDNLTWTCRPCNSVASNTMQAAGVGRLTRQYNPSRSGGAKNLGEWMQAVGAITPRVDRGNRGLVSDMPVSEAVAIIRATPHSKRSQFASQLRSAGRSRYNPVARKRKNGPVEDARKKYYSAAFQKQVKARAKKALAAGKKSGAWDRMPSEEAIMEAYANGAQSASEALQMAGARMLNPAKWERCVKEVQKRGGGNAYAVCSPLRRKKKNPSLEAIEGYEAFHGREPDEFVTVSRQVHFHKHLSGAGKLKRLVVLPVSGRRKVVLSGFGGALLAFNESRSQLFIEGGDQAVDVTVFGIDETPHELETLGQVQAIEYFTTKDHLGSEGGTATYVHKFRTTNENGQHVTIRIARYPDLIYRTLDQQLEFSGGSYTIMPEGIDR